MMTDERRELAKKLNQEIGKRAWQIGKISACVNLVKKELHMGNTKEALTIINELIKYIDNEVVPEFYETEKPESE